LLQASCIAVRRHFEIALGRGFEPGPRGRIYVRSGLARLRVADLKQKDLKQEDLNQADLSEERHAEPHERRPSPTVRRSRMRRGVRRSAQENASRGILRVTAIENCVDCSKGYVRNSL
jgi:hypothetical protein